LVKLSDVAALVPVEHLLAGRREMLMERAVL